MVGGALTGFYRGTRRKEAANATVFGEMLMGMRY